MFALLLLHLMGFCLAMFLPIQSLRSCSTIKTKCTGGYLFLQCILSFPDFNVGGTRNQLVFPAGGINTFRLEDEGHACVMFVLFVCSVGPSALTEECSVPDAMVGLSEYISFMYL